MLCNYADVSCRAYTQTRSHTIHDSITRMGTCHLCVLDYCQFRRRSASAAAEMGKYQMDAAETRQAHTRPVTPPGGRPRRDHNNYACEMIRRRMWSDVCVNPLGSKPNTIVVRELCIYNHKTHVICQVGVRLRCDSDLQLKEFLLQFCTLLTLSAVQQQHQLLLVHA